jgi:hypothetical protein
MDENRPSPLSSELSARGRQGIHHVFQPDMKTLATSWRALDRAANFLKAYAGKFARPQLVDINSKEMPHRESE